MWIFLLGFSFMYAAAAIASWAFELPTRGAAGVWPIELVCVICILPTLAGWSAAEAARLIRGRRLRIWHAAHSWWLSRLIRGLIAGIVGIAATLAVMVFVDRPPSDVLVVMTAAACSSAVMLLIGRRVPTWACLGCGYDLRGLTGSARGRCPECGEVAGEAASCRASTGTIGHVAEPSFHSAAG